jgi:hypothetical protein
MSEAVHHVVERFQQSTDLLDLQRNKENLDDAISLLAGWMEMNSHS